MCDYYCVYNDKQIIYLVGNVSNMIIQIYLLLDIPFISFRKFYL